LVRWKFVSGYRYALAACQQPQKRAVMLPVCACLWFRQELSFAVQHGDWRRSVAALLGRFLPKLRATRKGGLFSFLGCPVLAEALRGLQVGHPE
jgi:hypothetical protein